MEYKKLREEAIKSSNNAYSPYSKVKVGSALETTTGEIFSGCNVENSSYGATVCAERNAIFQMVAKGNLTIKTIYIYTEQGWPPCGICRQVMREFASSDLKIILGDKNKIEKVYTLEELLPASFSSKQLLMDK